MSASSIDLVMSRVQPGLNPDNERTTKAKRRAYADGTALRHRHHPYPRRPLSARHCQSVSQNPTLPPRSKRVVRVDAQRSGRSQAGMGSGYNTSSCLILLLPQGMPTWQWTPITGSDAGGMSVWARRCYGVSYGERSPWETHRSITAVAPWRHGKGPAEARHRCGVSVQAAARKEAVYAGFGGRTVCF
jgi:hypothetical protein